MKGRREFRQKARPDAIEKHSFLSSNYNSGLKTRFDMIFKRSISYLSFIFFFSFFGADLSFFLC